MRKLLLILIPGVVLSVALFSLKLGPRTGAPTSPEMLAHDIVAALREGSMAKHGDALYSMKTINAFQCIQEKMSGDQFRALTASVDAAIGKCRGLGALDDAKLVAFEATERKIPYGCADEVNSLELKLTVAAAAGRTIYATARGRGGAYKKGAARAYVVQGLSCSTSPEAAVPSRYDY